MLKNRFRPLAGRSADNIAETSLTIDGVRIVVDAGLERRQRFDPATGMSGLETARASRASAEQRRGRSGRTAPGACYRLWTESAQDALLPQAPAEILEADLAPLALELACWGCSDPTSLAWLDPPSPASLAQARDLLAPLEAVEAGRRVTQLGRDMASLGIHPRLAHMVLRARSLGLGPLACQVAALLSERDPLRAAPGFRDPDLFHRIEVLNGRAAPAHFDEKDRAAADAGIGTINHAEGEPNRHPRIDGIAAPFKHVQSGFSGEGMHGSNHALLAEIGFGAGGQSRNEEGACQEKSRSVKWAEHAKAETESKSAGATRDKAEVLPLLTAGISGMANMISRG